MLKPDAQYVQLILTNVKIQFVGIYRTIIVTTYVNVDILQAIWSHFGLTKDVDLGQRKGAITG